MSDMIPNPNQDTQPVAPMAAPPMKRKMSLVQLIPAIVAAVVVGISLLAVIVNMKSSTESRSKAAPAAICAANVTVPQSVCKGGCYTNADCTTGYCQPSTTPGGMGSCIDRPGNMNPSCGPFTQCPVCGYQSDLFWGPVIQSFNTDIYYHNDNRLLASTYLGGVASCNLVPNGTPPTPVLPVFSADCKDPQVNKYLTATIAAPKTINGRTYLVGTVVNHTTNCTYDVGYAIYKANGDVVNDSLKTQNLYDLDTTSIGPGETKVLSVGTPKVENSSQCAIVTPAPATPVATTPSPATGTTTKTPTVTGTTTNTMSAQSVTVSGPTPRPLSGADQQP